MTAMFDYLFWALNPNLSAAQLAELTEKYFQSKKKLLEQVEKNLETLPDFESKINYLMAMMPHLL